MLVLIFDDVINWILKPYIQTTILIYMALDVSKTLPVKFIRRGILTSRMWLYKAGYHLDVIQTQAITE